jgi:hypothetical protein
MLKSLIRGLYSQPCPRIKASCCAAFSVPWLLQGYCVRRAAVGQPVCICSAVCQHDGGSLCQACSQRWLSVRRVAGGRLFWQQRNRKVHCPELMPPPVPWRETGILRRHVFKIHLEGSARRQVYTCSQACSLVCELPCKSNLLSGFVVQAARRSLRRSLHTCRRICPVAAMRYRAAAAGFLKPALHRLL